MCHDHTTRENIWSIRWGKLRACQCNCILYEAFHCEYASARAVCVFVCMSAYVSIHFNSTLFQLNCCYSVMLWCWEQSHAHSFTHTHTHGPIYTYILSQSFLYSLFPYSVLCHTHIHTHQQIILDKLHCNHSTMLFGKDCLGICWYIYY